MANDPEYPDSCPGVQPTFLDDALEILLDRADALPK
jgi:hypothetical protein